MANYVDYDYWVQGYGEGDLSQPDRYVVAGYWSDGYALYEAIEGSAAITAEAVVTAKAVDFVLGSAAITANASFEATGIVPITGSASVSATATVTADAVDMLIGEAIINASATVTADGVSILIGAASVTASANVIAIGTTSSDVTIAISCNSLLGASGNVIGDEWSGVTPESNVWSNVGGDGYVDYDYWAYGYTDNDLISPFGAWTNVSAASNNWVRQ